MSKNPKLSGDDYLKNLFKQEAPLPVTESNCLGTHDTIDPAFSAANIPDLLSQMNLGFITPYIINGETNRMFAKGIHTDYLFFDYECPDTHTIEFSQPLPDDEIDDDELDDMDPPNYSECLGFDLGIPHHMSTGINIVFNEKTMLYQVDWAYLQMGDEDPIDLSCEHTNRNELNNFMVIFSTLAMKVVNGEDLGPTDLKLMRGFYNRPDGQAPGPQPV